MIEVASCADSFLDSVVDKDSSLPSAEQKWNKTVQEDCNLSTVKTVQKVAVIDFNQKICCCPDKAEQKAAFGEVCR